jgi:hypothetical protein
MPNQTQTNENKYPILEIHRGIRIYVKYRGRLLTLKNVEWSEIESVLDDIIYRYDEKHPHIPPLKYRLIVSGKLIIDGGIEIYEGTYSSVIAIDMILYLIARSKVDDETAYTIVMRLVDEDKSFIDNLIAFKTYEIGEDDVKQLYKIMEGIIKYRYPGLILRSRTRKTEEY